MPAARTFGSASGRSFEGRRVQTRGVWGREIVGDVGIQTRTLSLASNPARCPDSGVHQAEVGLAAVKENAHSKSRAGTSSTATQGSTYERADSMASNPPRQQPVSGGPQKQKTRAARVAPSTTAHALRDLYGIADTHRIARKRSPVGSFLLS